MADPFGDVSYTNDATHIPGIQEWSTVIRNIYVNAGQSVVYLDFNGAQGGLGGTEGARNEVDRNVSNELRYGVRFRGTHTDVAFARVPINPRLFGGSEMRAILKYKAFTTVASGAVELQMQLKKVRSVIATDTTTPRNNANTTEFLPTIYTPSGTNIVSVSYTHLTLPTKRIV